MHIPNGAISAAMTLLAALVFVGVAFEEANWPAVIPCFAALLVSVMAFSLFIGNFAIAFREWIVVRATGQMLVMSFAGASVPRSELPLPLEALGVILPITHGLEGLRKAVNGSGLPAVLDSVAIEPMIGCFYMVAGYAAFRRLEMLATRKGGYDQI